jgi:hypothetical protein
MVSSSPVSAKLCRPKFAEQGERGFGGFVAQGQVKRVFVS